MDRNIGKVFISLKLMLNVKLIAFSFKNFGNHSKQLLNLVLTYYNKIYVNQQKLINTYTFYTFTEITNNFYRIFI